VKKLCAVLFLLVAVSATADETPMLKTWELGLGLGAVSGPDYRGSKETHHYVAPIPYFIYRGKFIQSDREGVRGRFINTDTWELSLSLSANITPESDKNTLRQTLGLPALGSTIDIGPAVNVNLTGASLREGWLLSLPLRGIFAVGGDDAGYIGYQVQPQLIYRTRWNNLGFTFRTSVSYANADYHAYYYGVDDAYATAAFPAFNAGSGYSGWANQAAISHQFGDWRLGLFVRHDYLGGTEFIDSPLIETKESLRGGIALIWVMK
jgi:outer membrane protein